MSADFRTVDSRTLFQGRVISVREDTVQMPDGSRAKREIVAHMGAVVIVAIDDADQIVMVNQYRPAVGARLDELPAGLLDVADEPAPQAAARELAEEAQLSARTWHTLLDLHSSPGFSDEAVRVFLARDLSPAPRPDGFVVEHEEIDMKVSRLPLDHAVRRALAGEITNAAAVAGVLAAAVSRAAQWSGLRPADAPWPTKPGR
ncbi:MAG TPA: NUDIX hydrolase [Jatrophihabitans sp.]|jgi:ADP-ribose pyrophosphatase